MSTIQIELTDSEWQVLQEVADARGSTPAEVARDALARMLQDEHRSDDWKQSILEGFGMWQGQHDLPDFDEIRRSLDRNVWGEDRP